ncbi:hypothetical protein EDB81DRAFT_774053 [Dactylonectria macrodidyma]|uniref:Uncharacterized protein n=1 Tax=Dactylonectria macrodidyma TaxID=307937 RepID=A0A9P9JKW7_9HYPO|nr:hypothetical protein EDB81DRAFT_774053 [Dactylonectria macrodidyma]
MASTMWTYHRPRAMQNPSTASQQGKTRSDSTSSAVACNYLALSPFSAISPYLITCPPWGNPDVADCERYRKEYPEDNARYFGPPGCEDLPDNMEVLIRNELEAIFYEETASYLRQGEPFRLGWRGDGRMTTFNGRRLVKTVFKKRRNAGELFEYLNKEIMIYFQGDSGDGGQDDGLGRYIYREWLRLHGGRPPFQRHRFFAKPICFGERGPQLLQDFSEFHQSLYDGISTELDVLVDFYPARPQPRARVKPKSITHKRPIFGPRPSKRIQSWRDHGFVLGHLFQALYMVVDDQVRTGNEEKYRAKLPHEDGLLYTHERCEYNLSQCTVLLVKTGNEAHLHSPISFQSLFDAGLVLDVNRQDYKGAAEDVVVRVKVDVAVRFVWDVLREEQKALENLRQAAQALVEEQEELCRKWVEKVMEHARGVGIEENGYTWVAVRRARARLNGEAFKYCQVHPWWESVKNWEW